MSETATIKIQVDSSQVAPELKATTNKVAGSLNEISSKAKTSTKSASDSFNGLSKSTQGLGSSMTGLSGIAKGLGFGSLSEKVTNLGKGFEGLGAGASAGVAIAGVAGVGIAIAGAVVGILKAIDVAEKFSTELKAFKDIEGFEPISAEALGSIKDANASFDALKTIGKEATVVLVSEFAPAVRDAGTLLVAFGLSALDTWKAFASGQDVLKALAVYITDWVVQGLFSFATALTNVIGLVGRAAKALGQDGLGDALIGVNESYDKFTKDLAENAVSFYFKEASLATDDLTKSFGDNIARAKELTATQREVNEQSKKGKAAKEAETEAVKAQKQALKDQQKAVEELQKTLQGAQLDQLSGYDLLLAEQAIETENLTKNIALAKDAALAGASLAAVEAKQSKERSDFLETQSAELQGELDALGASFDAAIRGVISGWTSTINAFQGGVDSLLTKIPVIGGLLAALFNFFTNLDDSLQGITDDLLGFADSIANLPTIVTDFVSTLMTEVVPALVAALPQFLTALVEMITSGELIKAVGLMIWNTAKALVGSVGELAGAIGDLLKTVWDGFLSGWLSFAAGEWADVIEAGASAFWEFITEGIWDWCADVASALWENIKKVFDMGSLFEGIWQVFKDIIKEIGSFGTAKTKTFGDTPGPVKVGPGGLLARFSPGDTVVAARDQSALQAQVASTGNGGMMAQASVPTYSDVQAAMNLFLRDHLRTSSGLRAVTSASSTGRSNPFAAGR